MNGFNADEIEKILRNTGDVDVCLKELDLKNKEVSRCLDDMDELELVEY